MEINDHRSANSFPAIPNRQFSSLGPSLSPDDPSAHSESDRGPMSCLKRFIVATSLKKDSENLSWLSRILSKVTKSKSNFRGNPSIQPSEENFAAAQELQSILEPFPNGITDSSLEHLKNVGKLATNALRVLKGDIVEKKDYFRKQQAAKFKNRTDGCGDIVDQSGIVSLFDSSTSGVAEAKSPGSYDSKQRQREHSFKDSGYSLSMQFRRHAGPILGGLSECGS